MYTEQLIKIAIANGYGKRWYLWNEAPDEVKELPFYELEHIFLDPLFFQAAGKGLGWATNEEGPHYEWEWKYRRHRMIDHIDNGGTIESFAEGLLKK